MTDVAGESGVEVTVGPSEGLPPWTFATIEQRILALDYSIEELVSLRHANGSSSAPTDTLVLQDGDTLVISGKPEALSLAEAKLLKG